MNSILAKVLKNPTLKYAFLKTNVGPGTCTRLAHDVYHAEKRPVVTMDDMPVPCGSWQKNYNKDQSKFNKILGLGIVTFAVSVFVLTQTVEFNWRPPPPLPPRPELVKKK